MKGSRILLAACVGLGLAGCAAPDDRSRAFAALDTNNDGYISMTEAAAGAPDLIRNWARVDLDGDDRVGMAEFAAYESGALPPGPQPAAYRFE